MELCYIFSKNVFHIFAEMVFSIPKNEKFIIFSPKKAFLIFQEMELVKKSSYISGRNLLSLKNKKNSEKISYISGNGIF